MSWTWANSTRWDSFVKALQVRFGPIAYDGPMEALTRLKQTSSEAMYKVEFEVLSNRLKGLFERHKLSCFLSRLNDEIRPSIRMLIPINLSVAFGLAKIKEEYILTSRKTWKHGEVVMVRGSFDIVTEGVNRTLKTSILARKISSFQMDEQRKKGLCYHYDKQWNPSQFCKWMILGMKSRYKKGEMSQYKKLKEFLRMQVKNSRFQFIPFLVVPIIML